VWGRRTAMGGTMSDTSPHLDYAWALGRQAGRAFGRPRATDGGLAVLRYIAGMCGRATG